MIRIRKRYWLLLGLASLFLPVVAFGAADQAGLLERQGTIGANLPGHAIGQSVSANGVTVELSEARYSSSATVATFVVTDDSKLVGPKLVPWLTLTASGPIQQRKATFSTQLIVDDQSTVTAILGPILNTSEPVRLSIDSLLLSSESDARAPQVDGPWVFQLTPAPNELDSVDNTVKLNAQLVDNGVEIDVNTVHISSSDVRVEYHLQSDNPNYYGRANWAARMVFDDGTWQGGNPSQADPGQIDGDLEAVFPPLPEGVTHFRIEFGPYTETVVGPYDFSVPLPPRADVGWQTTNVPVQIAGENLSVDGLDFEKDSAAIRLTNISDGPRTLIPDLRVNPIVTDDLGNTYDIAGYSGVSPLKDDRGEVQSGTLLIQLREPVATNAQTLQVKVPSLARLFYGSWGVDVQIQ